MKTLNYDICYRRKDYFKVYRVTQENAQALLDLMGYAPSKIECRNRFGEGVYARITDDGIEFGNRFEQNFAGFGDYILDYDGKRLWHVYTPKEFEKEFYVWPRV